jgi:hypothetical protein
MADGNKKIRPLSNLALKLCFPDISNIRRLSWPGEAKRSIPPIGILGI